MEEGNVKGPFVNIYLGDLFYVNAAINLFRICYSGAEKFVYWLPSETAII